jgi:ATP-dependent DNA helicase DinG
MADRRRSGSEDWRTGVLTAQRTGGSTDERTGGSVAERRCGSAVYNAHCIYREWAEPADLGLPQEGFRPVQEYALRLLQASDKRFLVVEAPTGTGKSLLAAALGRVWGVRTLYMAPTIGLQEQFVRSFPHAKQVQGRGNYRTLGRPWLFPEVSAADCDKTALERDEDGLPRCTWCPNVYECPYEKAKAAALAADTAVVNLSYFLTEANHVGRFAGWQLAVVDEADELERALMDHISVGFPDRLLEELGCPRPEGRGVKGTSQTEEGRQRTSLLWTAWLERELMPRLERRISELGERCHEVRGRDEQAYAKLYRRLESLRRRRESVRDMLADLQQAPESWVLADDRACVFKPVRVSGYAEQYLWRHAERWLLMSASFVSLDQVCSDLGLNPDEVEWLELPMTFPKESRPIYYWPAAAVTRQSLADALPKLVERLDYLLDRYPGRALVHTHTYDIARYVSANSRHGERIVTYEPGHRDEALSFFKALEGGVLVAPSLERGVSLDDDLARLCVVLKVPYPNLGDRQVAARFRDGAWYRVQTVRALIQMAGRVVRSESDWGHTWILDAEFGRLWQRAWHLFPEWWREAVVRHPDVIREALERGEIRA